VDIFTALLYRAKRNRARSNTLRTLPLNTYTVLFCRVVWVGIVPNCRLAFPIEPCLKVSNARRSQIRI
jgi:hypothetical protein